MILNDQVIVVAGGAGLIGQAFCEGISKMGGVAVIADVNSAKASEISKGIPKSYYVGMDVTSKDSIGSAIKKVFAEYGKIDAFVNSAYPKVAHYGRHFFDVSYEDFCSMVSQHLGGAFLTSQKFAEFFIKQGYGNIINISSVYGVVPPRFEIYNGTEMTTPIEYAAIKSGLIHMTRYLAQYLKNKNIRVNCISPGGIMDDQPREFVQRYRSHCGSKGMLDSRDLFGALAFLLSTDSQYITGQNIIVDDGFVL